MTNSNGEKKSSGRPAIGPKVQVKLPQGTIDVLDTFASENQTDRAAIARLMIEHGIRCKACDVPAALRKRNERAS